MWSLRRPAVLQHLSRARAVRHEPLLRSIALPAAAQPWASARSFGTTSLAGVDMNELLNSSWSEIKSDLGRVKLAQVHRALTKRFDEAVAKPEVELRELRDLYEAADKTRLDALQLRTFEYFKQHYPNEIDLSMYRGAFRVLSTKQDGNRLCAVYDFARTQFAKNRVPEIVYRFGITGYLAKGDLDAAQELFEEMEANGATVSNDTYSRLLAGYSRVKDVESVLAIYDRLNPGEGNWHQGAVDRIILSLGVVGKPELAFEFYVNTDMKLNGGTLMTLLSVCRHNDCKQQAADILHNRKRFDMKLDCRAYNSILDTMEFLDQHDGFKDVLDEMTHNGVTFDTKTKAFVTKHQEALKGTAYDVEVARERSARGQSSHEEKKKKSDVKTDKMPEQIASDTIVQLLQNKDFEEAVEIASAHVRPVTVDDLDADAPRDIPNGALFAPRSMSRVVVLSYLAIEDDATVSKLVDGFSVVRGGHHVPLNEVVSHYSRRMKKNAPVAKQDKATYAAAYRAAKLMVDKQYKIQSNTGALELLVLFQDADAARRLCERVVREYGEDVRQHAEDATRRTRHSAQQVASLLSTSTGFFGKTNRVADALALFDVAHESGWKLKIDLYDNLVQHMRPHVAYSQRSKGVVVLAEGYRKRPFYYLSEDFSRVVDHLEAHGLAMNRSFIANAVLALSAGERRDRLRLLEAYAATRTLDDSFQLAFSVYSVLLRVCLDESSDVAEVRQIYDDAVAKLGSNSTVLRDWEVVFIAHLAANGHVGEAVERLEKMPETCGMYSYEAMVMVLRGALASRDRRAADTVLALLLERNFKPTLSDTYDVVHLAKNGAMSHVALAMIEQYEQAHGRETKDAVDHSRSHQSTRDKFAVRKIRAMYRVALKLCEQSGDWKGALAMSTRVNELLRFENGEGQTVEGTADNTKTDDATST